MSTTRGRPIEYVAARTAKPTTMPMASQHAVKGRPRHGEKLTERNQLSRDLLEASQALGNSVG